MCEVIEVDFNKKKKIFKFSFTDAIKRQKLEDIERLVSEIKPLIVQVGGKGRNSLIHLKVLDVMLRNMKESL